MIQMRVWTVWNWKAPLPPPTQPLWRGVSRPNFSQLFPKKDNDAKPRKQRQAQG